jgi:predicted nucleic-acid-binding protein
MPAVDTNVLLRLLLDDDEDQARAARSLQRRHASLFVSHVVLAEMAWVLRSAYGFRRDRLRTLVQMLLETDGISLQEPQQVRDALSAFETSRADFSDCLILAIAESAGMAPLATFDQRLAELSGTHKLGGKRKRR